MRMGEVEKWGCHSVGNAVIGPPLNVFFFIRLYIVGDPFKKYRLFCWTYSHVFENVAIAPPLKKKIIR